MSQLPASISSSASKSTHTVSASSSDPSSAPQTYRNPYAHLKIPKRVRSSSSPPPPPLPSPSVRIRRRSPSPSPSPPPRTRIPPQPIPLPPYLTRLLPFASSTVTFNQDHPTFGFSGSAPHFTVHRNRITIHTSDGDANRLPRRGEQIDHNGNPYRYEPVDLHAPEVVEVEITDEKGKKRKKKIRSPYALWRRKVGRRVAAIMFGRRNKQKQPVWELTGFPAGYTFWVTPKVRVDKNGMPIGERRDHYLYGSPASSGGFESPDEFAWHAVWLMRGKPRKVDGRPDCRCQYCGGGHQKPITAELEAIIRECDGEGRIGGGPQGAAYNVVEDEDEDEGSRENGSEDRDDEDDERMSLGD